MTVKKRRGRGESDDNCDSGEIRQIPRHIVL